MRSYTAKIISFCLVSVNVAAAGSRTWVLLVAGGLFRVSHHLSVGGTIHYESSAAFTESYNSTTRLFIPDTLESRVYLVEELYDVSAAYPWTVNLGAAWSVSPKVDI